LLSKRESIFFRFVSALLSVCLVLSLPVPAYSLSANEGIVSLLDPASIPIPEHLGKIEESFKGSSGKLVFYIQDAHTNYSAQKNIAAIINKLVSDHGIHLVTVEAAQGDIETNLFRSFPIPEVSERVMDRFLRKGEIGGPQYASITGKTPFEFVGVDKSELYKENLSQFLAVLADRESGDAFIRKAELGMTQLKTVLYSKEARELDRLIQTHTSQFTDLLSFLNRLRIKADELRVPLDDYAHLSSLMEFSAKLKEGQPKEEVVREEFKSVDPILLFNEIEHLSFELKYKLAESEEARQLIRLEHYLALLKHGFSLELTREDAAKLKNMQRDFKRDRIVSFMESISERHKLDTAYLEKMRSVPLDDYTARIFRFYEGAEEREREFEKRLRREMLMRFEQSAVLVTGGYHRQGMLKRLRAANISYAVITPVIDELTDHEKYLELMRSSGKLLSFVPATNNIALAVANYSFGELGTNRMTAMLSAPYDDVTQTELERAADTLQIPSSIGADDPETSAQYLKSKIFKLQMHDTAIVVGDRVVGFGALSPILMNVLRQGGDVQSKQRNLFSALSHVAIRAPDIVSSTAGFGAAKGGAGSNELSKTDILEIEAHFNAEYEKEDTGRASAYLPKALSALNELKDLTASDKKQVLIHIAEHAKGSIWQAYDQLPKALAALNDLKDLASSDKIQILMRIAEYAQDATVGAYRYLPEALPALNELKDLTTSDKKQILMHIAEYAKRDTVNAYAGMAKTLSALNELKDLTTSDMKQILFHPFVLGLIQRRHELVSFLSKSHGEPFNDRLRKAVAGMRTRLSLGGKVRYGTRKVPLDPSLSEEELADQIIAKKASNGDAPSELQLGVAGFRSTRARTIALGLFIASTDLKHFQGIIKSPGRDTNSPKGILISGAESHTRGDFSFTETPRARMDYIIPYPKGEFQDKTKLIYLLRFVRSLTYGLYLAETLQGRKREALSPEEIAIANIYIRYERQLVRILRHYEQYKYTDALHRTQDEEDHLERLQSVEKHKLEESLWPQRKWLVDLNTYTGDDKDWNELVLYLRRVEFTLLNMEPIEDGSDIPVSQQFLTDVRNLVFESAEAVRDIQNGKVTPEESAVLLPGNDPLLDPEDVGNTKAYALRVVESLSAHTLAREDVPNMAAIQYYAEIPGAGFGIARVISDVHLISSPEASDPTVPRRKPEEVPVRVVPRRKTPQPVPLPPKPSPPSPLVPTPAPQREPVPAGFGAGMGMVGAIARVRQLADDLPKELRADISLTREKEQIAQIADGLDIPGIREKGAASIIRGIADSIEAKLLIHEDSQVSAVVEQLTDIASALEQSAGFGAVVTKLFDAPVGEEPVRIEGYVNDEGQKRVLEIKRKVFPSLQGADWQYWYRTLNENDQVAQDWTRARSVWGTTRVVMSSQFYSAIFLVDGRRYHVGPTGVEIPFHGIRPATGEQVTIDLRIPLPGRQGAFEAVIHPNYKRSIEALTTMSPDFKNYPTDRSVKRGNFTEEIAMKDSVRAELKQHLEYVKDKTQGRKSERVVEIIGDEEDQVILNDAIATLDDEVRALDFTRLLGALKELGSRDDVVRWDKPEPKGLGTFSMEGDKYGKRGVVDIMGAKVTLEVEVMNQMYGDGLEFKQLTVRETVNGRTVTHTFTPYTTGELDQIRTILSAVGLLANLSSIVDEPQAPAFIKSEDGLGEKRGSQFIAYVKKLSRDLLGVGFDNADDAGLEKMMYEAANYMERMLSGKQEKEETTPLEPKQSKPERSIRYFGVSTMLNVIFQALKAMNAFLELDKDRKIETVYGDVRDFKLRLLFEALNFLTPDSKWVTEDGRNNTIRRKRLGPLDPLLALERVLQDLMKKDSEERLTVLLDKPEGISSELAESMRAVLMKNYAGFGAKITTEEARSRLDRALEQTYRAEIDDIDGNLTDPKTAYVDAGDILTIQQIIRGGTPYVLASGRAERLDNSFRQRARDLGADIHDIEEVAVQIRKGLTEEEQKIFFIAPENGSFMKWYEDGAPQEVDVVGKYLKQDGLIPVDFEFTEETRQALYETVRQYLAQYFPDPFTLREDMKYGFSMWLRRQDGWTEADVSSRSREMVARARSFLSEHENPIFRMFELISTSDTVDIMLKGVNKSLALRFIVERFGINEDEVVTTDDKASTEGNGWHLTRHRGGFSTKEYNPESEFQVPVSLVTGLTGRDAWRHLQEHLQFSQPTNRAGFGAGAVDFSDMKPTATKLAPKVINEANRLELLGEQPLYPTPEGRLVPRFGYKDRVDGVLSPRASENRRAIKKWVQDKQMTSKVELHFGIGGQGMSNSVQMQYWGESKQNLVMVFDRLGTSMKEVFDDLIDVRGYHPYEIVLDVSSKPGTTDETLILFQEAFFELMRRMGRAKDMPEDKIEGFIDDLLGYWKEQNEGKTGAGLFKDMSKARFRQLFGDGVPQLLSDTLGRLFFTTSLDAEKSHLHAFVLGMRELLGETVTVNEFDFSEYTGGRFTEYSESGLTTLLWRGLDVDAMFEAMNEDAGKYLGENGNNPEINSALKAAILTHEADASIIVVGVRSRNALTEALHKVQLFPESNGKDNEGAYVIAAAGSVEINEKVRGVIQDTGKAPLVIMIDVDTGKYESLEPLRLDEDLKSRTHTIRYIKEDISPQANARFALWFQEYIVRYGLITAAKKAVRHEITLDIPKVGADGMNKLMINGRPNVFGLWDPQNQPYVELAKRALVRTFEKLARTPDAIRNRIDRVYKKVAAGKFLERFSFGKGNKNLSKTEAEALLSWHRAAVQRARDALSGSGETVVKTDGELGIIFNKARELRDEIKNKATELYEAVKSSDHALVAQLERKIEDLHNQESMATFARLELEKSGDLTGIDRNMETAAYDLAVLKLAARARGKIFSPVFYSHHPNADHLARFIQAVDYGIGTRDQHANFQYRLDGKDVTFNLLVDFVLPYGQIKERERLIRTFGLANDYLDGRYPDEVRRQFLEAEYRALTGGLGIDSIDYEGNLVKDKRVYRDAAIMRLPDISTEEGLITAFRIFARAEALYREAIKMETEPTQTGFDVQTEDRPAGFGKDISVAQAIARVSKLAEDLPEEIIPNINLTAEKSQMAQIANGLDIPGIREKGAASVIRGIADSIEAKLLTHRDSQVSAVVEQLNDIASALEQPAGFGTNAGVERDSLQSWFAIMREADRHGFPPPSNDETFAALARNLARELPAEALAIASSITNSARRSEVEAMIKNIESSRAGFGAETEMGAGENGNQLGEIQTAEREKRGTTKEVRLARAFNQGHPIIKIVNILSDVSNIFFGRQSGNDQFDRRHIFGQRGNGQFNHRYFFDQMPNFFLYDTQILSNVSKSFAERAELAAQILKNDGPLALLGVIGSWFWNFRHGGILADAAKRVNLLFRNIEMYKRQYSAGLTFPQPHTAGFGVEAERISKAKEDADLWSKSWAYRLSQILVYRLMLQDAWKDYFPSATFYKYARKLARSPGLKKKLSSLDLVDFFWTKFNLSRYTADSGVYTSRLLYGLFSEGSTADEPLRRIIFDELLPESDRFKDYGDRLRSSVEAEMLKKGRLIGDRDDTYERNFIITWAEMTQGSSADTIGLLEEQEFNEFSYFIWVLLLTYLQREKVLYLTKAIKSAEPSSVFYLEILDDEKDKILLTQVLPTSLGNYKARTHFFPDKAALLRDFGRENYDDFLLKMGRTFPRQHPFRKAWDRVPWGVSTSGFGAATFAQANYLQNWRVLGVSFLVGAAGLFTSNALGGEKKLSVRSRAVATSGVAAAGAEVVLRAAEKIGYDKRGLKPGTEETIGKLQRYYELSDELIDRFQAAFPKMFRAFFGKAYSDLTLADRKAFADLLMWTEIHESDLLRATTVYGGLSNAVSQAMLMPMTLNDLWKNYQRTILGMAGLPSNFRKPENKGEWERALKDNGRFRLAMITHAYHYALRMRLPKKAKLSSVSFENRFRSTAQGIAGRWARHYHTSASKSEKQKFLSRITLLGADARTAYQRHLQNRRSTPSGFGAESWFAEEESKIEAAAKNLGDPWKKTVSPSGDDEDVNEKNIYWRLGTYPEASMEINFTLNNQEKVRTWEIRIQEGNKFWGGLGLGINWQTRKRYLELLSGLLPNHGFKKGKEGYARIAIDAGEDTLPDFEFNKDTQVLTVIFKDEYVRRMRHFTRDYRNLTSAKFGLRIISQSEYKGGRLKYIFQNEEDFVLGLVKIMVPNIDSLDADDEYFEEHLEDIKSILSQPDHEDHPDMVEATQDYLSSDRRGIDSLIGEAVRIIDSVKRSMLNKSKLDKAKATADAWDGGWGYKLANILILRLQFGLSKGFPAKTFDKYARRLVRSRGVRDQLSKLDLNEFLWAKPRPNQAPDTGVYTSRLIQEFFSDGSTADEAFRRIVFDELLPELDRFEDYGSQLRAMVEDKMLEKEIAIGEHDDAYERNFIVTWAEMIWEDSWKKTGLLEEQGYNDFSYLIWTMFHEFLRLEKVLYFRGARNYRGSKKEPSFFYVEVLEDRDGKSKIFVNKVDHDKKEQVFRHAPHTYVSKMGLWDVVFGIGAEDFEELLLTMGKLSNRHPVKKAWARFSWYGKETNPIDEAVQKIKSDRAGFGAATAVEPAPTITLAKQILQGIEAKRQTLIGEAQSRFANIARAQFADNRNTITTLLVANVEDLKKLMELTKREELASLLKNVQEIIPLRALPDETYLDEIESVIRGVLPKEALVRSGVVEKLRQIQGDQSVMLAADWITLTEEEAKMLDMVPERFRVSVSLQGALSNYLTLAGNTLKAVLTAA